MDALSNISLSNINNSNEQNSWYFTSRKYTFAYQISPTYHKQFITLKDILKGLNSYRINKSKTIFVGPLTLYKIWKSLVEDGYKIPSLV